MSMRRLDSIRRRSLATAVMTSALVGGLMYVSAEAYLQSVTVNKCLAGKLKSEGKGTSSYAGCYSKAAKAAGAVDPDCLTKASAKVTGAFGKLDDKYSTNCPAGTG